MVFEIKTTFGRLSLPLDEVRFHQTIDGEFSTD